MQADPAGLKAALEKEGIESKKCPKMYCRKVTVERCDSEGALSCPNYLITPKTGTRGTQPRSDTVIFYIHGGGYCEPVSEFQWMFASRLARHSGLPVDMVLYPQLQYTDNMEKQFAYVFAVYCRLLDKYAKDGKSNIIVLGDSAGSDMALTLCHHIRRNALPQPLPTRLMLLSPADCGEQDAAMLAKMRAIEPRDIACGVEYCLSFPKLFNINPDKSNYYLRPFFGDFIGFPPVDIYSGSNEIFRPGVELLVERLKAAGVPVNYTVGEGMMHDYPLIPLAPECVHTAREIAEKLRG
jgi:acetyl esterase/lipase